MIPRDISPEEVGGRPHGLPTQAEAWDDLVAWEGRRVEQLSFANNLSLGFAAATIGFVANLLFNPDYKLEPGNELLLLLALAYSAASMAAGVFVAWNRLKDFRGTADHRAELWELARMPWKKGNRPVQWSSEALKELDDKRSKLDPIGDRTYDWLLVQGVLWLLSGTLLGVASLFNIWW